MNVWIGLALIVVLTATTAYFAATKPAKGRVKLLASGRSRFPVTGDGQDGIIGVMAIAGVLGVAPHLRATTAVSAIAQPAVLVPRSASPPRVLVRLRAEHRHRTDAVPDHVAAQRFLRCGGVHARRRESSRPPLMLLERVIGEFNDETDTSIVQKGKPG